VKFVFHTSVSRTDGSERNERYLQILDEAVFAEEMGFDTFSVGEQHFNTDGVTQCCCPELVQGWIAGRTERIRLRWSSIVLLPFNHPLRVAERLGTLDTLTNGRAEIATARSNHKPTLDAFEVPLEQTRALWSEGLDVLAKAITQETFEHHGEHYDIPPVSVIPRVVQQPHPPLFYAATSIEGLRFGAAKGLGVIIGNSLPGGWEYIEEAGQAYHEEAEKAVPLAGHANRLLSCSVMTAHCAETMEQAKIEAEAPAKHFVGLVIKMFGPMAAQGGDYEYMQNVNTLIDKQDDLDYLIEHAPYISIGDPDFLIERFKRLEAMGYGEVFLRIDGMGHQTNLKSLEMFGKHVIPAFRNGGPS
jgi:alkanesulfonate monooxygenase SsuD/methylene tetrahydromethanopterin reductase-like flavin-dependent oxidoreductase (luciferase family)